MAAGGSLMVEVRADCWVEDSVQRLQTRRGLAQGCTGDRIFDVEDAEGLGTLGLGTGMVCKLYSDWMIGNLVEGRGPFIPFLDQGTSMERRQGAKRVQTF